MFALRLLFKGYGFVSTSGLGCRDAGASKRSMMVSMSVL